MVSQISEMWKVYTWRDEVITLWIEGKGIIYINKQVRGHLSELEG